MAIRKLDDRFARSAPGPTGNKAYELYYDGRHKGAQTGFGLRVTARGARSWIFAFTTRAHVERRYTIGDAIAWPCAKAREEVNRLRVIVDQGGDPQRDKTAALTAPTISTLVDKYLAEPIGIRRKKASSQIEDRGLLRQWILPELGQRRVAEITLADCDALHAKISVRTPTRANRVVSLLSRLMSLAQRWGMRDDNPTRFVERNVEEKRSRYLTLDELGRLTAALDAHPNQQVANAVRLMVLTGARRGETLSATWAQFDLERAIWSKPSTATKTGKTIGIHVVPLSAEALQVLAAIPRDNAYLFPVRGRRAPHLVDIKWDWSKILRSAGIEGCRLHDVRHSFASFLVSSGASLPLVGSLMGHVVPATTARYAHLHDAAQRQATATIGTIFKQAAAPKDPLDNG
jgi:integrase